MTILFCFILLQDIFYCSPSAHLQKNSCKKMGRAYANYFCSHMHDIMPDVIKVM